MKRRYCLATSLKKETVPPGNKDSHGPDVGAVLQNVGVKGRRDLSEAQVRDAKVDHAVLDIEKFIGEHRQALTVEWPSDLNKKKANLKVDISEDRFPRLRPGDPDVSMQQAMDLYRTRFQKPTWRELYRLVWSLWPILWYVVEPQAVLQVAGNLASDEDCFGLPEIRKTLRGLFKYRDFQRLCKQGDGPVSALEQSLFVQNLIKAMPLAWADTQRSCAENKLEEGHARIERTGDDAEAALDSEDYGGGNSSRGHASLSQSSRASESSSSDSTLGSHDSAEMDLLEETTGLRESHVRDTPMSFGNKRVAGIAQSFGRSKRRKESSF